MSAWALQEQVQPSGSCGGIQPGRPSGAAVLAQLSDEGALLDNEAAERLALTEAP